MWSIPEVVGKAPKPCSECSLTGVGRDRAVLLGGKGKGNNCIFPLNTVKLLDMSASIWVIKSHLICHALESDLSDYYRALYMEMH